MSPIQLKQYLKFAIPNKLNVLITGAPGIGKSDITEQVNNELGRKILISHPVTADSTDFKGLPFNNNGNAEFLPYSDLRQLMEATEPLTWVIDDLGQSAPSVQASIMQILLAGKINGHKISDYVSIIAATNRKQDKAGVTGILEPVKSRFASIIELEVNTDDWIEWALQNNMPVELISFIKFKPELLHQYAPTKEIINSSSPRTIANVGKQQMLGLDKSLYSEVFKGAAGEAFSIEYMAFLEFYRDLPNLADIIASPTTLPIPINAAVKYALIGFCTVNMTEQNITPILTYLDRVGGEISVATIKMAAQKNERLAASSGYIKWAVRNQNLLN